MATQDHSLKMGSRVFFKDTISAIPAYRQDSVVTKTTTLSRTRTGVSNPKWKQQVRSKLAATTQLDGIFDSCEAHRSSARIMFIWTPNGQDVQERYARGDIVTYGSVVPEYTPFTSKADARASARFLQKIRETEVRFSGPTFLGELRETMHMLRKPAAGLQDAARRYLDDVKRRNRENRNRYFRKNPRKYARNLSRAAAESWLEHAFGWVPLLHDIDDAREAFDDLTEIDRVEHVSAGGSDQKVIESFTDSYLFGLNAGLYFKRDYLKTSVETIRYRGGVRCQAATTASDKAARFGFTPSEFVPTAWELLPWSFLADYFANIGDILSASVTNTSNVIWVNRSWVRQAVQVIRSDLDRNWLKATFVTPNTLLSATSTPGFSVAKHRIVNRSPGNAGSIYPRLVFSIPGFDTSPGKWLNMSALLAQAGLDIHPQKPSRRNYRL